MRKYHNHKIWQRLLLIVVILYFGFAPVFCQTAIQNNFDGQVFKNQLSSKIQEEIEGKVKGQVEEWLKQGESAVLNTVYWSDMLAPYEDFGIDPNGGEYYQSALAVYNEIKNNPDYNPGEELAGSIRGMLDARIDTEIQRVTDGIVDKESQEIASQMKALYDEANGKITKILEGLDKIGDWDEEEEDFVSKVEEEMRSWGLKGGVANFIGDMDAIYNQVSDRYGTQFEMGTSVIAMIREDNPTSKIEAMFDFGATYGEKIPVLGDIVSNLFKVGQELLKAAKRAGGIIERNYGQGCFSTTGQHGGVNANKTRAFFEKFPNVTQACPLSQSITSGPYYHIYEENGNLYFYFNKTWHGAPKTAENAGAADIRAIIQWLRKIGNSNYHDLATIYEIYNKNPGFTKFRREIESKTRTIKTLVSNNISGSNYCSNAEMEKYLFNRIGMSWFQRLLSENEVSLYFAKNMDESMISTIADKMQENRYLRGGAANLNHLDDMITKLQNNIPVEFSGRVLSDRTKNPIPDAKVTVPFISKTIFTDEACLQLSTDHLGRYHFFMAMSPTEYRKVGILAAYSGVSHVEEFNIDVGSRTNYDGFDIYLKIKRRDEVDLSEKDACEEKEGYVWDEENEVCVPAINCDEIENTTKILNEDKSAYVCDCFAPFVWNEDRTLCLSQEDADSTAIEDCTGEFEVWNETEQICDCITGYSKNDQGVCQKDSIETPVVDVGKLRIIPNAIRIDVADEVSFQVIFTSDDGTETDVTNEALDNPIFFPGKEGVHTKTANYQGLSVTATVTVSGCADPNAEEVDGNCQCKEGYSKNYLENCEESSKVYRSISISPTSQSIGVGDDPSLVVTAVNALGQAVDVTNQALQNTADIGNMSGVVTVVAEIQGLRAEAQVIVNECSDPNAVLNTDTGDCDCKDGYSKNDLGVCVQEDSDCPFPNMENINGECNCVDGFLPADNGGCISEEDLLEEMEEEALEECETLSGTASEFSSLVSQISFASSDFTGHSDRFNKEVNDRASDLCENQVAAYSYAQALTAYSTLTGAIDRGKDVYYGLQLLNQCPNFETEMAANGLNNYDLSGFLDMAADAELSLGDMESRIKENGCNEEDLEDTGRTVVDQDKDPELVSSGGTGIELEGDGKDNDGDGQEDEISVTALPGYNVTIVVYDSGDAKDDVFALYVDGAGDLGTTPEGGLRSYPLQLPMGSYNATITVLDDGGNVGTFAMYVLVNGIREAFLEGEPKAGGSATLHFDVN